MKINKEKFAGLPDGLNVMFSRDELNGFSVHGRLPQVAVLPDTYEQVSEVVRYCSENKLSVIPYGSGTKISLGNGPDSYDVALGLEKLNKIVHHNEMDFIATVQAGAKLEDIQSQLVKKDQFIALDPPLTEQGATIGGIISSNDSGPSRLRYKTCREQVLEVKVVRANGEIIRGGAKVVKNVAGYDLPKLFVGSLGTLGIIVEATLKVHPIAERSVSFILGIKSASEVKKLTKAVLEAELSLTAFEIINRDLLKAVSRFANLRPAGLVYAVVIKIENVSKAVDEQIRTIDRLLKDKNIDGVIIKNDRNVWKYIRNFPFLDPSDDALCRINVLITDIPKVLEYTEDVARNLDLVFFISAKAGIGSIQVLIKGESRSLQMCVSLLGSYVAALGGNVMVQRLCDGSDRIDKWSGLLSSYDLMKVLKKNFDPGNVLSPGRLL